MNCPACNVELRLAERQGIEIDYCPQCRGVWLDRGELDKIIEKSMAPTMPMHNATAHGSVPPQYAQQGPYNDYDKRRDYRRRDDDDDDDDRRGRKRGGFLGDLFDF